MLLGLPIPTTNIGKIIPALLHNVPVSQQLYALHYNCKQVATQFESNIANSAAQGKWKFFNKYQHFSQPVKLCLNFNFTCWFI
jgi:hypothetical protein